MEALADRQFGVVSIAQLQSHGRSREAIEHAVRSGRLHRLFYGVYAVGSARIGSHGREFAALLACGEGAVVSHRTAAALMGLLDRAPASIDVIALGQRGRKIEGIRRHGMTAPMPWEVGVCAGIPCTSPARTLVDIAGEVSDRTLRSCFERAAARRLLDLRAIEASLRPAHRGMPALRGLLGEWRRAQQGTLGRLKSPLEAMVLPLLAKRGIRVPLCNAPVDLDGGRIEVDFLWPEQRFVLEADSRDFHGTEVAFEVDRWRDRELMRVGYGSLRVTRLQAEREPGRVADAVERELASRRRSTS